MSYRSLWLAAAAAVASGILSLLSIDLGPIGPLALIAPTPVLVYALVSRRTWTVALAAFAARAIGGLGTAFAYASILPPFVLIAWTLILALLFTLVVLATRWIAHRAPAWAATLAYPAFATTAEFLFSLVSPHGSFGAIGYALVDLLPLLQIASMGGLAALSFCAGLCAMGLAVLATTPRAWPSVALVAGAPLLLVLAFGAWRLSEPYDERVRVTLITNDALRGRASGGGPATREVALSYAEALRERAAERPEIVVLPEALFTGAEAYEPLADAAAALGVSIVAGFVETLPDGRRVNAARVFAPGADAQLYIKRRLIPGLDVGFATGDGPLVMGDRGVAICKDMDFAPMIREYGARGVRLMLTPAWDFVVDGRMHARMAVVRGVENGFALARAAADGKLTVSDRYGRIIAEATTSRDGVVSLVADVGLKSGGALYVHIGDAFGWIVTAAAAILLAFRLIVRRGRRARSSAMAD